MQNWWPLKIVAKLLLSWIPERHRILRKFGMFKHGRMDEAAHAHKIFKIHTERAFPGGLPENFIGLELGPGDSMLSALVARAYGAQKIYLADAGNYASSNIDLYKQAINELKEHYNLNLPDISNIKTIDEMMKIYNITYITNGLNGLASIPSQSVDFIWSHSVVEHIRKHDFEPTMRELARILKKDGVVSHLVDLQDHLNKSLNNLRFPEAFWENNFVANAGFYTNRLRYSQSLDAMRKAGFEIIESSTGQWDNVPLPRQKLIAPYNTMSDEELRIRTYSVILNKAA